MLTFFTTAKAFEGHSGIIQRNALASWTLLHPDVEVILFGDDKGAAEIAAELGLRHVPLVERNEFGTKRLDSMFQQAQSLARHNVLCYVNCDIILFAEFIDALRRVQNTHERFLMVGRRWDTDIAERVDFSRPETARELLEMARTRGVQRGPDAVDYFVFRRNFYSHVPALVVGRIWWDHWLVWKARQEGGDIVDASELVTAIHQNHGYGYHPGGASGVWTDVQAARNEELAGGKWHLFTIADATHIVDGRGERRNYRRWLAPYWRYLRPKCAPLWFAFLDATRAIRRPLGLDAKLVQRSGKKV